MSLYNDLQNAGLPVISATDGQQATFSRTLTEEEREIYLNLLFPDGLAQRTREADAINQAALATQLKSITPAQAVTYIENNVTDLPSAKAVLKIIARMLIAIRDKVFSTLPER